jgi:hypothetical protein
VAIGATANWYVQNNPSAASTGNDNNGMGFDPGIAGAGTNYALRATPILTLTDLAAAQNSTTLTSATGGFTAAMIGNAIHITAGTNFVAGFYFVTAVASLTSCTLDRAPATAGAGSVGTGRLGGSVKSIGMTTSSSSPVVGGNDVFIAPGVYRETLGFGMSSPGSVVTFQGDPGNTQQFTDGAPGVPVSPGESRVTNYTTNDTTAPAAAIVFSTTTKSNLTFSDLYLVSGSVSAVLSLTNGTAITFNDCVFEACNSGAANLMSLNPAVDTNSNWNFNRCVFVSLAGSALFLATLPTSTVADYSAGITLTDCLLVQAGTSNCFTVTASGANSFKGGGVSLVNCTLLGGGGFQTNNVNLSITFPCTVNNCLVLAGSGTGIAAQSTSQVTESYNRIIATTARTNVLVGTGSVSNNSYAALMELGQAWQANRRLRPFLSPTFDSPHLAFGALASPPLTDLLNLPKPSGGGRTWSSANGACGAYERHDAGVQNVGTTYAGRSNSVQVTGPGDALRRQYPVQAGANTFSVPVYRDGSYGGGNNPQVVVEAAAEIGVAAQTLVDSGPGQSWNLIPVSIQATGNGVVWLRFESRDTAGASNVYWGGLV